LIQSTVAYLGYFLGPPVGNENKNAQQRDNSAIGWLLPIRSWISHSKVEAWPQATSVLTLSWNS